MATKPEDLKPRRPSAKIMATAVQFQLLNRKNRQVVSYLMDQLYDAQTKQG